MKNWVVVFIAFVLSACAGSPARIAGMSPDELKNEDSRKLCGAYAFNRAENVKKELLRRNAISSGEWKAIDEKKMEAGMSELALVCSFGQPSMMVKEGENQRWLYHRCTACPATVVLISNGKVTSSQ